MEKQYTKNQHFIPRMILKNFCLSDNKIFVYNIDDPSSSGYHNIKSCAKSRYLYEFRKCSGKISYKNTIENILSYIEDKTSIIIDNIINSKHLSEIDLCYLNIFIFFQFLRTEKSIDIMIREISTNFNIHDKNCIKNFILKSTFIDFNSNTSIINELVSRFEHSRTRILFVDKPMLLSKEYPVMRLDHPDLHCNNNEKFCLILPISPKILVEITPYVSENYSDYEVVSSKLNNRIVDALNKISLKNSNTVFCDCEEHVLEYVK